MPIRAFVSQNIPQLQATLALLEKAMASGSLNELRIAGVVTSTGNLKQNELQLRYNQVRYELYLQVQNLPDTDANKVALVSQFTNPYAEKAMKVSSRSAVGVFGYPLPAPLVPPSP